MGELAILVVGWKKYEVHLFAITILFSILLRTDDWILFMFFKWNHFAYR